MARTKSIPRGSAGRHVCGCYVFNSETGERTYLPQVKLDAHTTILSTASRTLLKQTFVNSAKDKSLDEIRYAFPLFDGVSVVDFICQIGERTIYGLVKEKGEARKTYEEAKARGESAALLEQLPDAADVFTTSVSNVPGGSSVHVTITYVQELKHDAEVDGVRLTIPTSISPRYGSYPGHLQDSSAVNDSKGISLTIDASMAEGIPIKKVISPSHPIEVSLGSLSTSTIDDDSSISKASATLSLGTTELEKDFVLQVVAKDVGIPQAILETHPTLPNQRALMTTLVPKFNLKFQKPEIIFVADRSGSMVNHIPTLVSALKVFLKSIPVGCMFNICSFGSSYKFLWPKSQVYDRDTLAEAVKHVDKFGSDFGGTETLNAVKACCEARHKELPTELMLLTDGDIWSQEQLFEYVSAETKSGDVRVFPIGIGGGVSSALIEGVGRAGRGFAQMVADNEKLESKIVRMLKGALTPHIKDYRLEVKYEDDSLESVADSLRVRLSISDDKEKGSEDDAETDATPISLYNPNSKEEHPKADEPKDIFAGLPKLNRPKLLQTPYEIPPLFPFNRTCVYLLMAPEASHLKPKSVVLKGTSPQGPLELEIPVEMREEPDGMIHQLAARKAIQELEEGRGWVLETTIDDEAGVLVKDKHPAQFALLQRREAVRLGVEFQVGGKYCSFVAVEANEAEIAEKRKKTIESTINQDVVEGGEDWEMIEEDGMESSGTPYSPMYDMKIARERTGGKAARKQLSSQAARPSPVTYGSPGPSPVAYGSRGGGSRGGGLARGGAMRHRDMYISQESVHEEEEDLTDYSDEDMGYGLFDGDSPAGEESKLSKMTERTKKNAAPASKKKPEESGTLLQRLIARQSFEGSWTDITDLLCDEMKIRRDAARSAVVQLVDASKQTLDKPKAEQVASTAIIVVFLEKKMLDEEETWELVVEKARTWLEDAVAEDILAEAWKLANSVIGE